MPLRQFDHTESTMRVKESRRRGARRPLLFRTIFLAALMAVLPPAQPATAGDGPGTIPGPTVLIYFENDLFYNEDRYYTNAVQARVISPDLASLAENGYLPDGISSLLGDVPFPGSRNAVRYNLSFGFGQQIYTPKDTDARSLQKDDRPYAGYLYGTLALHAKRQNRLDTLELAAGVVGPSSRAEQAQNGIHKIRSLDTAEGWRHQLRDEPALMLTWTRIWRLNAESEHGGWGWDVLPRIGASVGNPFTRAGIGAEVRFGWNMPEDYGSSTIRPGSGITRPLAEAAPGAPAHAKGDAFLDNFSVYLFAGADGQAVAWNTFLDGNMWKDSHSVDRFPLAGDLSMGIAAELYDFRLTYTHVYRAKEFHGQPNGQNFGSIMVGYRF